MPPNVAELESQALQLQPEDRALLADRLLASLSSDAAIEEAWAAEALRRLAELESGSVAAVSLEAAVARARSVIR
jgi:putative addiction module component (TIGR02574 family)